MNLVYIPLTLYSTKEKKCKKKSTKKLTLLSGIAPLNFPKKKFLFRNIKSEKRRFWIFDFQKNSYIPEYKTRDHCIVVLERYMVGGEVNSWSVTERNRNNGKPMANRC